MALAEVEKKNESKIMPLKIFATLDKRTLEHSTFGFDHRAGREASVNSVRFK